MRLKLLLTPKDNLLRLLFAVNIIIISGCQSPPAKKPNVMLIMIDDLNDCIELFKGHPQSLTPNINKLAKSGTSFLNAHTNAPMCGPSRASMLMGIYPHKSGNFFMSPWFNNPVLRNRRTLSEQFKKQGYQALGTGKILHHLKRANWDHFENHPDYGPVVFDGTHRLPHPDVPPPFSNIGSIDGSLGPLTNLAGRTNAEGKPIQWIYGYQKEGTHPMRYRNDEDRDPTPDEKNAAWTAEKIKSLASQPLEKPFFLAVGFLRPHTPLIAPKKYFDRFPLSKIKITIKKEGDADDTFLQVSYGQGNEFALGRGEKLFNDIIESYGSEEEGLKRWTQAYLACVAAVDDNVGQVMDALDQSSLKKNTVVVLASDHGFHMGEKDYLYKNSLWEESTRVPLIMRVPGVSIPDSKVKKVVSLIDVYPTLIDFCGLSDDTLKNEKGRALDGHSLRTLIENPEAKSWKGEKPALTVVYAGPEFKNDPTLQHYAIRTDRYRYILYNNGKEELYDHQNDPNEWNNLVLDNPDDQNTLLEMRDQMAVMVSPLKLNGFISNN